MEHNIRYHVITNLIRTVCLTLLSFVSFPFVCRMLGDAAIGTYTWANTFVYYFLIIAKLGIPTLAIRECSKVRHDKLALSQKAQEFFIIQAFLTLLSFGLMCTFIYTVQGDFLLNKEIIFILSLNFLIGVFSFEWIFISLEKHFYISFRSIAALSLSSLLIIGFIKYPDQVYLYSFLTILVTIITVFCNIIYIHKFISFRKIKKYNFRQYFNPLMIIFAISLVGTFYNHTDTIIVGLLDPTKSEVGSYSVGIKSIEIIITIITSLSAVFIPRATALYKQENKVFFNNLTKYAFNICLFIAIPAAILMIILAPQITAIISGESEGFTHAPLSLMILASMVITYSLADMMYSQVLLPMNKEKYYLWVMLGGTILNILGSIALGLVFNNAPVIGIAIATMASDVLIFIALIVVAKKHILKALFNKNTLKLLCAGSIIAITSLLILPLLSPLNEYSKLLILVLLNAIIYLGVLIVLKEDLTSSFVFKKSKSNL